MSKIKRGKYKIEFKLISESPVEENEFDITKKYLELIEKQINMILACICGLTIDLNMLRININYIFYLII